MTIEEIKKIIHNYDLLTELVKDTVKTIEKLNHKYSTGNRITEIDFYDSIVSITCDYSCRGCWDEFSFEFPIDWLTKSQDELKFLVEQEKKLKEEKLEKERLEKLKKEELKKEEKERKEFERLKAKFEP